MKVVLGLAIAVGLPLVWHRLLLAFFLRFLLNQGMARTNYAGEQVLTAGGLMLVASMLLTTVVQLGFMTWWRGAFSPVLVHGVLLAGGMGAMACWGWIDDRSNDGTTKGFRGHFRALWQERHVTSGMWKLIGGGLTAAAVSIFLTSDIFSWLVACGLLAISPNILNLFDLRPGRAIKVYGLLVCLAIAAGVLAATSEEALFVWLFLLPLLVASVLLFPHDAGGRIMLGDTGANALGFSIGYLYVTTVPLLWQVTFLAGFVALQVAAEFVSFSRVIERQAWLRRLDEWGR
ncbi:UDP-N-acetylmuramyl pentapeptide phosphotransferase [Brevibacillus parabrevis]|uniref:UDP-N-acetylmuramyl pentapeptide phosphotransferase n=1 Tax=Brevibacillus parabrevis TaxID=54914 RepID=UPI001E5B2ED0|nr:UDP-N-acetylmuramyl pentapeptide phosphotransferase [Brevibacillus parabrevis]